MNKTLLITIVCATLSLGAVAQRSKGSNMKQRKQQDFEQMRERQHQSFNEMRQRINQRYAEMLERIWSQYDGEAGKPKPNEERKLKPLIFSWEEEEQRVKQERQQLEQDQEKLRQEQEKLRQGQDKLKQDLDQARLEKEKARQELERLKRQRQQLEQDEQRVKQEQERLKQQQQKNREIPVQVTPQPQPQPQPEPTVPIDEKDKQPKPSDRRITVSYYGTSLQVRVPQQFSFSVGDLNAKGCVSRAWMQLSKAGLEVTVSDCLELRRHKQLCDWAYLQLLQQTASTLCRKGSNEAELVTAYLYSQSGYQMRLGAQNGRLLMLFSSRHQIYDMAYWTIDNEMYYPLANVQGRLNVSNASFPGEQPLSLQVNKAPQLSTGRSGQKQIASKRYSSMSFQVNTNRNLIDFYDSYPTSMLANDFGTRWAMYANTELSATAQQSLYPALRQQLAGKSEFEQVSRLLNLLQTGLVYEYDDKVWGHDRAFFAEETLYYPYADCEDRAILLSRLVRDLVGLPVVLLYYPGHLAAAVGFNENVSGDYVQLQGRRYVVCDPTYIGAPVGATMPGMDNATAKLIY